MNLLYTLLISFALALDAFSVSIAAGAFFGKTTKRQKFRLSFHFGLFQFLMPVAGWYAGSGLVKFIASFDHWVAFAILSFVGGRMIREGLSSSSDEVQEDITLGLSLLSLSIATSIDALAVGFSLCIVENNIFYPAIIIGLVAAGMSLLGIQFGEKLSGTIGKKATIAGGVMLILIGLHIVAQHLNLI